MSESSESITSKMKSLLEHINGNKLLLSYGFVRESCKNDIPDEIIDYIVVYAFLFINKWLDCPEYWKIDEANPNKMTVVRKASGSLTIYADPIIDTDNDKGTHEWRVKIHLSEDQLGDNIYIGISSHFGAFDTHFYGAIGSANKNNKSCYCYSNFGSKMDHIMGGSEYFPSEDTRERYSNGDIVGIHLNCDNKSVAFSKNDKYLGVAFDDIVSGKYRLVVSSYGGCTNSYEIIQ